MKPRDFWSFYTHFTGAILSFIAIIFLIGATIIKGTTSPINITGAIIFGISMLALYCASSIYHYVNRPDKDLVRLRKLDHAMIYVLIAGTYTPIALGYMNYKDATIFMAVIWLVAAAGIIMKIFWLNAPRWLYTSLYVVMGWAIVFDWKAFSGVPAGCLALIAAGGISYTVGAGFYAIKKPNLSARFGFHEIFHLFVVFGSVFHFNAVYLYII